ncbi:hypothetical protein DFH09DRAFT_1310041 [Mycena vulgaris]|nr:hypothetical protein DFH09DRAFT_1310041 [Mycena vulgaris]
MSTNNLSTRTCLHPRIYTISLPHVPAVSTDPKAQFRRRVVLPEASDLYRVPPARPSRGLLFTLPAPVLPSEAQKGNPPALPPLARVKAPRKSLLRALVPWLPRRIVRRVHPRATDLSSPSVHSSRSSEILSG